MLKILYKLELISSDKLLNKITNLSQLSWGDVLSILPEIYLLIIILVALVLVGTSNFVPVSNEVEKKTNVAPSLYMLTINAMWITGLICIFQFLFFWIKV